MSSQKTRHKEINSYLVMNSLRDKKSVHTAALSAQDIKIEYMCTHYKYEL